MINKCLQNTSVTICGNLMYICSLGTNSLEFEISNDFFFGEIDIWVNFIAGRI